MGLVVVSQCTRTRNIDLTCNKHLRVGDFVLLIDEATQLFQFGTNIVRGSPDRHFQRAHDRLAIHFLYELELDNVSCNHSEREQHARHGHCNGHVNASAMRVSGKRS